MIWLMLVLHILVFSSNRTSVAKASIAATTTINQHKGIQPNLATIETSLSMCNVARLSVAALKIGVSVYAIHVAHND